MNSKFAKSTSMIQKKLFFKNAHIGHEKIKNLMLISNPLKKNLFYECLSEINFTSISDLDFVNKSRNCCTLMYIFVTVT